MRLVLAPGELAEALAGAKREAASAFGDDRVLIEKHISTAPPHRGADIRRQPRQCRVALFERECTLQRRHQKVVEEAPCDRDARAPRRNVGGRARRLAQRWAI